jgi:PKD repeat protein
MPDDIVQGNNNQKPNTQDIGASTNKQETLNQSHLQNAEGQNLQGQNIQNQTASPNTAQNTQGASPNQQAQTFQGQNQTPNFQQKPQINTTQQTNVPSYRTFSNPNPTGQAPNINQASSQNQIPQRQLSPQELAQKRATNIQNNSSQTKVIKPVNMKARKRAIFGCFTMFFVVVIMLLVFSFIFISNAENASENPIARLLNVDPTTFVNGLITFIHIIFLITALGIFLITMTGLVKMLTAKKDDKDTKKQGIKISAISGAVLFVFLISWLFAFVYLDGKRIIEAGPVLMPIITTPENTIGLEAPVLIKFDGSNVPYDSNNWQIISYQWNFGDETTGSGAVVSKTYSEKGQGRFDVELLVTRRNKNTNEEMTDLYTWLVTIEGTQMQAVILAEPLAGEIPLTVSFDASRSSDADNPITSFEWDFDGDLSFDDAKGETVEHTFDKAGKYLVSLRIINAIGNFATTEIEIDAKLPDVPEAVIEISGNPVEFERGRQYIFSADKSVSPNGRISSYEWDFGDGKPVAKTRTASHTYEKDGTYRLVLRVVDEKGKEGESEMEIKVGLAKEPPKAEFQTDLLQGRAPLEITFDGSLSTSQSTNIVQYEWDFENDGVIDAFNMRTKHTYQNPGTYTAKLIITDSEGTKSEATQAITVQEPGIVVDLKTDRIDGTVPLTVAFDASGSSYSKGTITSYRWDFGDGSSPKLGSAKINHRYDKVGIYTATVEVIASDNTTAKKDILITIREVALFSCFVSVFKEGKAPLTTSFDPACSTGTISRYFWDFGDGNTSTALKPNHTFERPGEYTVSLEVIDSDNTIDRSEVLIKVLE